MDFKVILLSILVLLIISLVFGLTLFFRKNKPVPQAGCRATGSRMNEFSCGCGIDECLFKNEK